MTSLHRLVAGGYVLALLVISLVGQVFSLPDLKAVGVALFVLTGWGIGPALLAGSMSVSSFVLTSGALSLGATTLVGYVMARGSMWHPTIALVFAAISALAMLVLALPADIRAQRGTPAAGRGRLEWISRTGWRWSVLSIVGALLIAVDALNHRGVPTSGGLLTRIGPLWYLGALVLVTAAVLAWIAGASPALPLLILAATGRRLAGRRLRGSVRDVGGQARRASLSSSGTADSAPTTPTSTRRGPDCSRPAP